MSTSCDKPGVYGLHAFVTHLGSSIGCGHYVCHILKLANQEDKEKKWVYYDDAKVAVTDDAPFGKGYIYFFTKK